MKKWLVAFSGLLAITLWSMVIFIAVTQMQSEVLTARPHGVKDIVVNQERMVHHIPRLDKREVDNKDAAVSDAIIGKTLITEAWVDDVTKDGRLSIDTLLASLEVGQDSTE